MWNLTAGGICLTAPFADRGFSLAAGIAAAGSGLAPPRFTPLGSGAALSSATGQACQPPWWKRSSAWPSVAPSSPAGDLVSHDADPSAGSGGLGCLAATMEPAHQSVNSTLYSAGIAMASNGSFFTREPMYHGARVKESGALMSSSPNAA